MKAQLLETTRLFLAVERAADLGEQGVALSELAHEFGLSSSSLRRFLEALDETAEATASPDELVDWSIDEQDCLRVFYAPGLDREIPLGGDEASALMMGLDRLGLASERRQELQGRLLARLSAAEAERLLALRHRLMVKAEHRWRPEIDQAIAKAAGLRILYESASGRSWRRILPSATVDYQGQMYLGAWCFERKAPRMFRGDRLFKLEPWTVDTPAGEAPDQEALRARLSQLTDGHMSERIVLRCADDDGAWMLQDYFGPDIRLEKGRLVVREFAGQALVNWIVSCTGSVLVESPAGLAERVAERAGAVIQSHAG
jgi:predicted DNA-binding transcriptional regulator YafY